MILTSNHSVEIVFDGIFSDKYAITPSDYDISQIEYDILELRMIVQSIVASIEPIMTFHNSSMIS